MRFDQGAQLLQEMVGRGVLEGRVTVDQVYAWTQHEGYWRTGPLAGVVIRSHPRGGQGKFLEQPLLEHAEAWLRQIAGRAFEHRGLEGGMRRAMDELADRVHELAPRETDVLRNSAHVEVRDRGAVVYDRPPTFPRLSAAELREVDRVSRRRGLGAGFRHARRLVANRGARQLGAG